MFIDQLESFSRTILALDHKILQKKLSEVIDILVASLSDDLPLLICGNGGSAADAQHIAGELVGKFYAERRALNVRSLTTDTSVLTSWTNDVSYETVFSRQVEAYGKKNGVLLAISTSGNSKNVIKAAKASKNLEMTVVALSGFDGGDLANYADILLCAPFKETPRIQEVHMMMYHYICEEVEKHFISV